MPLKKQKATSSKKEKGETIENSARERGAEFGGINNTPVAISLESTIDHAEVLILFFSHSSTNWPEGFEGAQSVCQKSSSELFWKTKGNNSAKQFWSPTTVGSWSFLDMRCA